jgi:hypothetical protein
MCFLFGRLSIGDANASVMLSGGAFLDPSALTLGFARRFATYKRALLIFQDLTRDSQLGGRIAFVQVNESLYQRMATAFFLLRAQQHRLPNDMSRNLAAKS